MFPFLFKLSLLTLVASSPNIKYEIVGGDEIDIKEAPYQVAVYYKGLFNCGGSVVDHDVIITAAHCLVLVDSPKASDFSIRAGSSNMNEGGQFVHASSIIPNSNYTLISCLDYDVGIIRLVKPLVYSDVIKPIQMADVGDEIPDGADTTLTGWGQTSENGNSSKILRRVVIQKVNDFECSKIYKNLTSPRSLCAGMPKGGKGHCHGDSGGPLVYNSKLVGIVSWGIGCGEPGYPSVFTKVAAMRKWIDENIKL